MSIFDWFKRPPDIALTHERAIARLETRQEQLELQWANYKDEFNRMLSRLDQRDRRAAQKAQKGQEDGEQENLPLEVVAARLRRTRRG